MNKKNIVIIILGFISWILSMKCIFLRYKNSKMKTALDTMLMKDQNYDFISVFYRKMADTCDSPETRMKKALPFIIEAENLDED